MTEKTDIRDSDEKVVEIEMERLRTFTNHPFKVIGDSQMIELQDSIKKYGVLNPLIVRPRKEGYYEIISGHRRKYAAERLGYKKIPVIIRMMQDDEAVVTMVDSNLQREQITASEKAYAYKMKYDAIKKKAGRKNRYVLYCAKRYVQIDICITKISTFLILCDLAVCLATLYVSFSLVFALMRYLQGKVFLIRFYSPTTLSSSRAEFRLPSRLACA